MKNKISLEILAPAGAREQLEAAVACGADAVYLGAGALNARRGAGNFEGDALREAVEYCHVRGVAVHLALNTVVLERELGEALAIAKTACDLGIDALIVQDLGLAALLRKAAPDMPLHASTQMAVHNLFGALQLEELGFSRIVLAREMSREEIVRVVAGTKLETEIFVHGALCMCVSGQCYMSGIIGERSGNRGLCAQPCRLPFFEGEKGRCGLSLKDLSLIEELQALRELGVDSVKIEGRMKRPEYVAAAVTACREARDNGRPDLERLRAVFSRSGFTDGYYKAKLGSEMFGTRQKEDVTAASSVLSELSELYRKETPRVGLVMTFTLKKNEPVLLKIRDNSAHEASVKSDFPEEARQKPTTPELVEQSLTKLGGTPYFPEKLELDVEPGLCVPVSQMNRMRREALEELTQQRAKPLSKAFSAPSIAAERREDTGMPKLRARFATAEQARVCDLDKLEQIILPVLEVEKLRDKADLTSRLAVELPRIYFEDGEALQTDLKRIYESGIRHAYVGNLGGLYLAKKLGFILHGGWALNVTNSASVASCEAFSCEDICLSFELNLADCKRMNHIIPRGILSYGYLPLMVVRNCPARAEGNAGCASCTGVARMRDRLGNSFPVTCSGKRGVTEVLNHVPLYLADRLPELSGLDFSLLWFTIEEPAACAWVLEEYQTGGRREKLTRGLYYRNLQ